MVEDIFFMGKKIDDAAMRRISDCFDEKIDDIRLCQAVLVLAMKKENALARSAFARALKQGYCSYADGKREARQLIREARRRLGYKYTFGEKLARFRRGLKTFLDGTEFAYQTRRLFDDVKHFFFRE
ncbi:MAG: hypothetical protein GC185_08245 [Alphaproteobacteria bacterium]|nr:hypothetical protein [Alphaproteobacteria bacterium]